MGDSQSNLPLLRFERVACERGGRLLFEDLSFALGPGEAALVKGPNGAGKSSLLRLAAGLLRPAAGRVERGGGIALLDEKPALDAELPLARALGFWARIDGADDAAVARAMERFGIARLAAIPVRMLSAGQRQRAGLCRLAASDSRAWLLDEPANALDAEGLGLLAAAIAGHLASGGIVIAASHQPLPVAPALTIALPLETARAA